MDYKAGSPSALFFSGTSNVVLPVPNKQAIPEAFRDKSRLTYYATLFNSVEINSTFKKLPMTRTVERWAAEVGDDFRFTFKLPSSVTHNRELVFDPGEVIQFLNVVSHVGNKKGCLLAQFPGKLTAAYSSALKNLLDTIRRGNKHHEWKLAVEFRHHSWYDTKHTYQLLDDHNAAIVFHDMPNSTPAIKDTTGDFVYLRFHGPEKGYRGSYPDAFLLTYAQEINNWTAAGKNVYAYFNNTLGNAARNLLMLKSFVEHSR